MTLSISDPNFSLAVGLSNHVVGGLISVYNNGNTMEIHWYRAVFIINIHNYRLTTNSGQVISKSWTAYLCFNASKQNMDNTNNWLS